MLNIPLVEGAYSVFAIGGASASVVTGSFTSDTTGINPGLTEDEDTQIYDIRGHRLPSLQRGLNIIRKSDGTTRKIYIK